MVRTVQGFKAISFSGKKDEVKLILGADKDDIRAGTGDIRDVLESLELHSTASDSSTISVSLFTSADDQQMTSYEFVVNNFSVKPDKIKLVVEANTEEIGTAVLSALGYSVASGSEIELRLQSPE